MIIILGILAAVAIPQFSSSDDALAVSAASVVSTVRTQIDCYHAKHQAYPPAIDPNWFQGGMPANPYWPDHPTPILVADKPAKWHPTHKFLKTSSGSTFWYNRANGRFCARVARQASNAETIALYNRVNNANIQALNQTDVTASSPH